MGDGQVWTTLVQSKIRIFPQQLSDLQQVSDPYKASEAPALLPSSLNILRGFNKQTLLRAQCPANGRYNTQSITYHSSFF